MYDEYINYLKQIDYTNIKDCGFKSDTKYRSILEHVSYELGQKYLDLILSEFDDTGHDDIFEFITINDRYGSPQRYEYVIPLSPNNSNNNNDVQRIVSSPTTLRYIYHALVILRHYSNTQCENMVEVGCGYGGLCLAIQYFSKIKNIKINNYNLIDLPEVGNLIAAYLALNMGNTYSNLNITSAYTYGKEISNTKLFFISNYCYTELDVTHNTMYSKILLPTTDHGFIIWQNGGNRGSYPIGDCDEITGKITNRVEEKPQTDAGYDLYMNYFVYF